MDNEQDLVAAILRSTPGPEVPADFVPRVNARIEATAGWLGLADFRVWTLRLSGAAAALALVAALWSAPSTASKSSSAAASGRDASGPRFSPASSSDWQRDVSADALLDAALRPAGASDVR